MGIKIVRNLTSGQPPVPPPGDLERYIAYGAGLAQGVVVKVDASGAAGDPGRAALANVTGADAIGVTVHAADQDAKVRIQFLMPGMVLKGNAAAALQVGDTCRFNATLDGFDDGTGATVKIIQTEEDADGNHTIIYGVLTTAGLY